MTRVLAAALLSVLTLTASVGLASAATQGAASNGSSVGTSAVTTPAPQGKIVASAKPVSHKKKVPAASVSSVAPHAASTQEVGKPMAKTIN
jgi:hypothetical protein